MLCGQALTRNKMIYSTKIVPSCSSTIPYSRCLRKVVFCCCHHPTHRSIIPIAVMDKSGRNVATLWHFALTLLLLRKVDATHHFVVTLCLHRGEHSSTGVHKYALCTHTHVHTSLAKRCTLDEIVPMMDTLHSTVQSNTMNTQHITLHFTHYIVSRVLCKVQVSCAAHVAQVTQKTWTQLFLNVMPNTLVDHLLGSITMQLVPWR